MRLAQRARRSGIRPTRGLRATSCTFSNPLPTRLPRHPVAAPSRIRARHATLAGESYVRLYGAKLTMRDETNPQVSGHAHGALMTDGRRARDQDVTVNATDTRLGRLPGPARRRRRVRDVAGRRRERLGSASTSTRRTSTRTSSRRRRRAGCRRAGRTLRHAAAARGHTQPQDPPRGRRGQLRRPCRTGTSSSTTSPIRRPVATGGGADGGNGADGARCANGAGRRHRAPRRRSTVVRPTASNASDEASADGVLGQEPRDGPALALRHPPGHPRPAA